MLINSHYNMSNFQISLRLVIAHQHQIQKRWLQLVNHIILFQTFVCLLFCFLNFSFECFVAGQVGVLHHNIKMFLNGKSLTGNYDGYASCPLVTGYDSCIMAEFDYDLQPKETFPFRQDCERYSMFLVKRDIMPLLYWHLMLKGHWNGPEPFRKLFSFIKF